MWLSLLRYAILAWLLQLLPPTPLLGTTALAVSPPVSPAPAHENRGNRDAPRWADAYSKARRLVGQMTVEEKANVTRGFARSDNVCAGNSGSVPRLRWPGMCLHDAANGVRATDMVSAYPAGLHVGAAWDRAMAHRQAVFMAGEFKAKGVNVVLGPNAGPLGRTPLGGRNWEGFSVDPYLSGQLNAETVSGYQAAGVIASIKHLVGNEQETYRRPYFGVEAASSNIDDKTLHEYYLWPFMDGLRAGAASVMCSYNRVNNTYGCANDKLLNGILKTELGFAGFVLLDWNAQHGLDSANAGLDMVMPLGGAWGENLTDAVRSGSVSESRLTDMATRILAAWYLVGQDKADFPVPGIGMKNLSEPHKAIDARVPESKPVLLDGAISGHVLVKNKGNSALPLKAKPAMLSVFGYDAAAPPAKNIDNAFRLGYTSSRGIAQAVLGTEQHFDQAARGGTIIVGGRAGANAPPYISDPLSAIQQRAEADNTWVNWDTASLEPDVNGANEACLVFINAMATEGWDRDGLHDDASDGLVRHVASRCANTIVIVHAAGIRLVDQWIDHDNVTATVIAHLPGQDSGRALVRLLYGEANFSGKLPYTLARNESDYPVYAPCGRQDNTTSPQCDYAEGVYLDYRAFDAQNVTPRFEFGFGLSYTSFNFSSLVLTPDVSLRRSASNGTDLWDTLIVAEARVTNAGTVAGAEVAQLYLGIPRGPPKQLRGFEKVSLGPGESATVRFALTRRDLSAWDVVRQQWVVQGGEYPLFVGASSRDIRLTGSLVVDG
ncbi:fibronectin type III-like domain-containing protein [Hirsutella rhossiliensis]|uniref:Beta-glucosidase cel3A n=1 Tax=Hirsutella rhossiliensis TaxID=111463 RepID=A0A9P8SK65_9HYPO|nr:fibronectin type III-like domain-containing protein [Hirsutella rhossiliensis]KAH0964924.1 fibronectin type III-like domain-containing protein [Hirsutella rhossiliensis]